MKRNFVLLFEILEVMEARGSNEFTSSSEIPGYNEEVVAYHMRLLALEGFIRGEPICDSYAARALNWKAHDALAIMRGESVMVNIFNGAKECQ